MRLPVFMAFALAAFAQDPAQLLEQGRTADAERALAAELRAHPDDVRSLMLMAIALDQQQRFGDAEPYYQRALRLAPSVPALLNNAGNHYVAMARPADARRMFEKVVALEPDHANANLQLARLAAAEKHGAEVIRRLDRLPASDQGIPAVRLLRARALAWAGRKDASAAILRELESAPARDERLDFSLGLAWADNKMYDEAETAFSRALASAPADRDILYNLGLAAIGARHFERATQVLDAAIRQKPDDVDALYALARSYAEAGNNEMALMPLVAARKVAPKRADVLEFIGHVSDALGYYGDAVSAYDDYLTIRPDNDVVRRERAFCLVRVNRLEEGIGDLQAYVAKHPKDPAGLFQLALAESVKSPEQAFTRLNQALALKPDYIAALFSRGSIHLTLNRPAEAIQDLRRVLEKDPDNVRALDRIGQAYLYLDQPEPAVKLLARAAELAPSDPKVLTHYAQALRSTNRLDEARAVMAKFRQLPEEVHRLPLGGVLDFLSLPPAEQRERYFERLQKSAQFNAGNPDLQVRLGNELLARGRTAEALEAYRRARALDPDPKRAAAIGKTLVGAEQWAGAREFLEPASGAASIDARLDLVIALFHSAGAQAGLAELDRIDAADRNGDYFLVRAQVLDRLGKFDDAVAALNAGFRAAPSRPDLYFEAANFLMRHERYREAADLLDQAVRAAPDVPELRLSRAIVWELTRRTEDALRELAAIRLRWPEWSRTYVTEGIILNVDRKPEQARQALETAVALGADGADAYYFLALSITESAPEDRAGASRAIAAAVARNEHDPYIRQLAGKLAYNEGDFKAAIAHLKESVRGFPDFFQAHYHLANAYRAIGDEDNAQAEMKEVRRIREGHTKEELELQKPPLGEALIGRPKTEPRP